MKDYLGQRIKVGDVIVYPVRRRSAMWLSTITVTDLGRGVLHGTNHKGRRIKLSKPDRCVIIRGQ
jgi:hypothetical protein